MFTNAAVELVVPVGRTSSGVITISNKNGSTEIFIKSVKACPLLDNPEIVIV
jgi:hypothetical protein